MVGPPIDGDRHQEDDSEKKQLIDREFASWNTIHTASNVKNKAYQKQNGEEKWSKKTTTTITRNFEWWWWWCDPSCESMKCNIDAVATLQTEWKYWIYRCAASVRVKEGKLMKLKY